MRQADIRLSTSKSQLAAGNGFSTSHSKAGHHQHGLLPQHADSPRSTPRPAVGAWGASGGCCSCCCCTAQQVLSGRGIALLLLLLWVLLAGCFVVRHGTRLLDAAGQQHHLLHLQQEAAAAGGLAAGSGLHWGRAAAAAATHAAAAAAASTTAAGASISSSSSLGKNLAGGAAVLAAQAEKWPDGYVAICAVVKDQWPDLRYWIEYHRWLGVSKFYIFDNNSTLPSMLVLWDYMQQGVVDYQYFLGRPRRKPDFTDTNQYRAYQACLLQHFRQHRWMAYIDADEFLVFPDAAAEEGEDGQYAGSSSRKGRPPDTGQQPQGAVNLAGAVLTQDSVLPSDLDSVQSAVPVPAASSGGGGASGGGAGTPKQQQQHSLPLFLAQFEGQAAIGINWVLFGSSGQQTRPPDGPLASYIACVPRTHWESSHVKVIANTGGILGMGYTPHEVIPRPGHATVDVDQIPFRGPRTPEAKWHKLVLHHYVLKSRAEFVAKKARGSGAGNRKDWSYWQYVEQLANATCPHGQAVSAAFLATQPRLALPPARVTEGCHERAAAAYQALLTPVAAAAAAGSDGGSSSSNERQQQRAGSSSQHGSIDEWLPC